MLEFKGFINDELKIYRGDDYSIQKHITIHLPTLGEICDYGEQEYYQMVYQMTYTPQSMKWQLWENGIDFTKITPFELFYSFLYLSLSKERTSILFGDLDFTKFEIMKKQEDGSIFLYQTVERKVELEDISDKSFLYRLFHKIKKKFLKEKPKVEIDEIIIDEFTYTMIVNYLCVTHGIKLREEIPANESSKIAMIEDAEEEYLLNKDKPFHSNIKNMISAMVNCEGFKYDHSQVWNLKINVFLDSVKRIFKIKNSNLLLQSGYSGFGINLKEIDDKKLDWLGELE